MVTDFLRACNVVQARMVRGSDQLYPLRFYRAKPGAKALPFMTATGHPGWDDARLPLYPAIGTQAQPLDWRPNAFPDAPPGDHYHGLPDWFLHGLPASELDAPTTDPPAPECNPMLRVQYVDETVQIDDVIEIDVDPARGLTLSPDLGTGTAHLGTVDADPLTVGLVNTELQRFAGVKQFDDDTWHNADLRFRRTDAALGGGSDVIWSTTGETQWVFYRGVGATESPSGKLTLNFAAGITTSSILRWENQLGGTNIAALHLVSGGSERSLISMDGESGITTDGFEDVGALKIVGGVVTGKSAPTPSPGLAYMVGYRGP